MPKEATSDNGAVPQGGETQTPDLNNPKVMEDLMGSVMTGLAPDADISGGEDGQKEEGAQSQETGEDEGKVLDKQTPESEAGAEDNPPEPQDEGQAQAETLAKQLADSQAMIGRQSNEIGQLRKSLKAFQQTVEGRLQQRAEEKPRYWEKLKSAPEGEVAKVLSETLGEEFAEMSPSGQAKLLKFTANMIEDIVDEKTKPLIRAAEEAEMQKQQQLATQEWLQEHPDVQARQPLMEAFIREAYPDGLEEKDENGNFVRYKADPYMVAHLAYVRAGEKLEQAGAAGKAEADKKIVAGRSHAGSAKAVSGSLAPKPKLDPIQAEIEESWAKQQGMR